MEHERCRKTVTIVWCCQKSDYIWQKTLSSI